MGVGVGVMAGIGVGGDGGVVVGLGVDVGTGAAVGAGATVGTAVGGGGDVGAGVGVADVHASTNNIIRTAKDTMGMKKRLDDKIAPFGFCILIVSKPVACSLSGGI